MTTEPELCEQLRALRAENEALRKHIEAYRAHSEARLRSIFESAQHTILSADRDGRLTFVSRTLPELENENCIGRYAWEFVRPEDAELVKERIADVVRTKQLSSYETVGCSGRMFKVSIAPVLVAGEVSSVTFSAWDVTAQRELEARIQFADRMATLGTLAAGVAHEINNPLTYLLANLIRSKSLIPDPAGNRLLNGSIAHALEGAERIRDIVRDLSAFSTLEDSTPDELDVRSLLESSLRIAHNQIRCRARLVEHYEDVPRVLAGESRLGQVFLNLLVNAAHAIPEGNIAENEIRVRTRRDSSDQVVIEISDTGHGIRDDLIDKIFEPFFTTKPPGVGTGLGLYICRNILSSLGGEISVMTAEGQGSTFRVTLPAAPRRSTRPPSPQSCPKTATSRGLKLLLVDDESAILTVMQYHLADHHVSVARSGREALSLLEKREFDAVFCDLVMPDLTGMDVYEKLKQCCPGREQKIIFMTGGAYTDRARQFLETVPNRVLEKPFSPSDLTTILSDLN